MTRSGGLLPLAIALLCTISALQSAAGAAMALAAGPGTLHPADTGFGVLQTLIFLFAGTLSAVWLYGAHKRVRAAGAAGMSVGPIGATLWFFVPIATLVMPAKGMSELRRASINPRDWEAVGGFAVLKLWWTSWLLSACGNAAALKSAMENDPSFASIGWWGSTLSDLFGVPAAICFAILVLGIDRRLAIREREGGFGAGSGPMQELRAA